MRRLAVINQKGGVGKTTTTANLGAAMALGGKRVLLIDLDPQAHLTLHYGATLDEVQPTIYDVLTGDAPIERCIVDVRPNVSLLPSDIDLAAAETELVSVTGREVILRESLDRFTNPYDVLLIDCPPSLGVLTVNALVAAEEVLIPLQTHFFALQGLSRLLETVILVRRRINAALRVNGVVLCMHDAATKLSAEVAEDLITFLNGSRGQPMPWADAQVYASRIRRNIKLAESSSYGQTVFDYAPRSNGATDYAKLASEMFGVNAEEIIARSEAMAAVARQSVAESPAPPDSKRGARIVREAAPVPSEREIPAATAPTVPPEADSDSLEAPPVPLRFQPAETSPLRMPLASSQAASRNGATAVGR